MKSMGIFFKQFFESFPGKYVKNIIQEMKSGLSLRQQQVQVITIYYIRSLADKTNASRKKTNNTFIFLKDTDILPKLLF